MEKRGPRLLVPLALDAERPDIEDDGTSSALAEVLTVESIKFFNSSLSLRAFTLLILQLIDLY